MSSLPPAQSAAEKSIVSRRLHSWSFTACTNQTKPSVATFSCSRHDFRWGPPAVTTPCPMPPVSGPRRAFSRRLRALGRRSRATETALLVPVPEANFVFDLWRGDRGRLGVPGLPLHVTVIYPFLEPCAIDAAIEGELEDLAGSRRAFGYTLSAVDRFPGVLYLTPSPADGFIELIQAVHSRWPSHPPYRGVYDDIVPHVTLILGEEPAGLAELTSRALPVRACARELVLLEKAGSWRERARFSLAGPS